MWKLLFQGLYVLSCGIIYHNGSCSGYQDIDLISTGKSIGSWYLGSVATLRDKGECTECPIRCDKTQWNSAPCLPITGKEVFGLMWSCKKSTCLFACSLHLRVGSTCCLCILVVGLNAFGCPSSMIKVCDMFKKKKLYNKRGESETRTQDAQVGGRRGDSKPFKEQTSKKPLVAQPVCIAKSGI